MQEKINYFILRDYFTTIETTCGAINFLPRSRNIFNNNINNIIQQLLRWEQHTQRYDGKQLPRMAGMSTELLNDKGENLQQLQQHKPTTVALVTTQRAIKKKNKCQQIYNSPIIYWRL